MALCGTGLQSDRRRGPARHRERPCRSQVVRIRHSAQADEGVDAAQGRPGDPRHAALARPARAVRRRSASALWGTWWAIPFFIVYGVLYGSHRTSRWHECGHGTAFKTRWMNDVVYQIACFMIMREPDGLALEPHPASHRHHHRRPRPGDRRRCGRRTSSSIVLNLFGLSAAPGDLASMVRHASGRLTAEEKTFVPEMERPKVYRTARIWLAIYAAVDRRCAVTSGSWLPLMLIGPAAVLRRLAHVIVRPHPARRPCRGRARPPAELPHHLMNPVFRFLYWNMNYHVEHHMFPMVPYHALPELHEEIKHDCPPPYPEHLCRLSRDHPGPAASSARTRNTSSSASCRRPPGRIARDYTVKLISAATHGEIGMNCR